MPIDKAKLKDGLKSALASPENTHADCAQAWADAMSDFASGVVPPSTAVSSATSALSSSLATAFALPVATPGIVAAFTAFAAAVGAGMAGFVPTPPPTPVGLVALFAGPKPATHDDAATAISDLVDIWMRTGTAVAAPAAPVNWS